MSATNDSAAFAALANVTTATLMTILLKKDLRNVWIRGAFPLTNGQSRIVGRAFTVRFILSLRTSVPLTEEAAGAVYRPACRGVMARCASPDGGGRGAFRVARRAPVPL